MKKMVGSAITSKMARDYIAIGFDGMHVSMIAFDIFAQ